MATIGTGATLVTGEDANAYSSLYFASVTPEREMVTFGNESIHDVDVSGCVVAFEYGNSETNQRQTIPSGTKIGGGQRLIVATGAEEVPEADVTFDYDSEVIDNDGNDVITLLSPDKSEVLCSSEDEQTTTNSTTSDDSTTTTTSDDTDDTTTTTTTGDNSGESDDSDC
ncbi:hypothetical protein [Haladaptatus sp. DYF46]|uniref:hypothetical protein n=1 Tax=Haladaptatus sp. DYF46 TaxID=2886041 RepID=UPI001E2B59A9|nr:hypothetical protein [Haladaptatus sp. DYF46]